MDEDTAQPDDKNLSLTDYGMEEQVLAWVPGKEWTQKTEEIVHDPIL